MCVVLLLFISRNKREADSAWAKGYRKQKNSAHRQSLITGEMYCDYNVISKRESSLERLSDVLPFKTAKTTADRWKGYCDNTILILLEFIERGEELIE